MTVAPLADVRALRGGGLDARRLSFAPCCSSSTTSCCTSRRSRAAGVRVLLANGRISDRSFPRYRFFRPFVAPVLRQYDRILAREETDRRRFIEIGAPREIVQTSGNVKFDYVPDERPLEIAP